MSRVPAAAVEPVVNANGVVPDRRVGSALWAARGFGVVLTAISVLPLFAWLQRDVTGAAGRAAAAQAGGYYDLMWSGLLLIAPIAVAAGFFARSVDMTARLERGGAALLRIGGRQWALLLAAIAFVLTAAFVLVILDGRPYHIDAIAQFVHARFWAAGTPAGPANGAAFWMIQNSLVTDAGWVSQYPPGHIAVLALASLLGAAWLAGPVMAAVTVFASARFSERLLDADPVAARVGSALLAVSPFFIFLSGSFMNHVTTAAFLAVAGSLLVRDRIAPLTGLCAGISLGFAFATRPLVALAVGLVLVFGIPFVVTDARAAAFHRLRSMLPWLVMGGMVPVIALLAYNAHFFGSPFTFGYEAALGPAGALGFGIDPWGNRYDLLAAAGYTSADLLALAAHLLESPLPPVLLIAGWLLTVRSVSRGVLLLMAVATAVLGANFLYWHHGMYMGPRMLFEAAPVWLLLFAVAVLHVGRRIPDPDGAAFSARNAFIGAALGAVLLGLVGFAPQRARSYAPPPPPAHHALREVQTPAIVFVHEAWRGRLAMRLAAAGMRLDSVETILRQNTTCQVQQYADARDSDAVQSRVLLPGLSLEPRAVDLPQLVEIAPNLRIVGGAATVSPGACAAELRSDLGGVQDLASLLAFSDLPGSTSGAVLFVRDLGPVRNRAMLDAYGSRTPYTLTTSNDDEPVLLHYDSGMRVMWTDSSALSLERS